MLVSAFTLTSPISTSIVAPALGSIADDLHIQSSFVLALVLSIFILAYVFGPFIIGPLSEIYGRVVILQLSNLFYLTFNTACGFAKTTTQMLIFRFLGFLGGRSVILGSILHRSLTAGGRCSAPISIGGGILADCWDVEERGMSIGIYTLAPLPGPVLGPIASGFITENTT